MPEVSAQLDGDGRWANGVTESWWFHEGFTNADAAGAAARWKSIGDAGAEGWAGDYFRGGETHGVYMRWSPRAGFVIAHVDKCGASVMGLVYGRAEASGGMALFFPELDKHPARGHGGGHGGGHGAAPRTVIRFVPVEWRGRRLLIAEDEMGDFGDYLGGLGRYNGHDVHDLLGYDYFFSLRGGYEPTAAELAAPPVVPPGYERFLKRPITARVASVGRRVLKHDYTLEGGNTSSWFERASLTHVTINAGTEQGVKDGMVFRVSSPDEGDSVHVVRAGRRSSTAVVVREVDERGRETYDDGESRGRAKVARGWRLTTSPF